ncbi:MAG: hypothetical protein ONB12_11385 [candidate division KSB1 bacterium]|nr:hypothetical protein [candidate division KSB1 bacterium]
MKALRNSAFIVLLAFSWLRAGGRHAGAALELGVGARPLALGTAAGAMGGTGETFFYNPASLGLLKSTRFNLMYAPTFGSLFTPMANYNYFGFAYPMPGGGVLSINWTRFAVDDIPVYPELKGKSYSERNADLELRPSGTALGFIEDTEDVFYFSFAKTLESIFPLGWWYGDLPITLPIGVNFKLIRQVLGEASASGMGIDVGTLLRFNFGTLVHQRELGDLSFGFTVRDLTKTPIVWNTRHQDRIERSYLFGMAYEQPILRGIALNFYYSLQKKYEMTPFYGAELIAKAISLRVGRNEVGLTAGAGFHWRYLNVDYAYVTNAFEDVHRLSCSVEIAKRKTAQADNNP